MSVSPEQIALTAEQKQRLARLAEQTGRSWDELLADAIASLENGESTVVGTPESVYDAMVRLGLLGCVKDGPPDLSSNPKYIEGFGRRGR